MQYNKLKHKDTPSKKTDYKLHYLLDTILTFFSTKMSSLKVFINQGFTHRRSILKFTRKTQRSPDSYINEKISILSNKKTYWIKLSLYSHFGFIGLPEASIAFVILRVARTVTIVEKIYKASSYYKHSSAQLINAYRV